MTKKTQNSKQTRFGFVVLDFPSLTFNWLFVCFGFRASNFKF